MTRAFLGALRDLGAEAGITSKTFSRKVEEVNRWKAVKAWRYVRYLGRFMRDLKKSGADLAVYFPSSRRLGLLAEFPLVLWARVLRVPYILYLHTRGYGRLHGKSFFFRWIIDGMFRPALGVLVLGRTFEEEIRGFSPGKIFILPNCLEGEEPPGKSGESPGTQILFLSNLQESKGIRTLVGAIPEVVRTAPNALFVIAGPWQDRSVERELRDFLEREGVGKSVRWTGPVYGREKDDLFGSSDMFVFPTHYPYEAMSLVVLEAMRSGLPVITSDVGALSEVVLDGRTGFVLPPRNPRRLAEKILLLVHDPRLRRRMGEESRRRFREEYSSAAYRRRIGRILEALGLSPTS